MTGYGRSEGQVGDKKVVVEVRSLNSKQLDLALKTPQVLKEKEMAMRKMAATTVGRGKCEIAINFEGGTDRRANINQGLASDYYAQITSLAKSLSIDTSQSDLLGTTLKMPEVLQSERGSMGDDEWAEIKEMVEKALSAFNNFRTEEGKKLDGDLETNINQIADLRVKIEPFIGERLAKIKERILKNLDQVMESKDVDQNRFEQELIFYLEKYDVSEEMTRLAAHCSYFKETMGLDSSQGKKLGFISQEIGREINTLGAKSYDADMQRIVVQMKDSLEKIKEQVLNVL